MKTGLMTSGPFTEYQGQAVDLNRYLALVKSWGLQTLDIFPGFFSAAPPVEVRKAMDAHGLTCACYYIAADLDATGAEAEAAALEGFKQGIENATVLGAPVVFTHGTQHTYAGEDMFQRYSERLGEMLPLFAGTGMTFVVENAGTLMHKVADMLRLMDAHGGAGLRLCLDTGNFHLWGQDEVEATKQALKWTVHFHVKDYVDQHWAQPLTQPAATQVDLGSGDVKNLDCLALLKQAGWHGTLALEPQSIEAIEPGLKLLATWTS